MSKRLFGKSLLTLVLVLALLMTVLCTSALADTDWEYTLPSEAISVVNSDGTRYLTTTAQRAGSEIPLIFGINAVATNMNSGAAALWGAGRYAAGTNVNENPDPYLWNYNFMQNTDVAESLRNLSANDYINVVADGNTNSSGLYSSGGANQIIDAAHEEWGGVSVGIYNRADIFVGYSDALVNQVDLVNNFDSNSDYYQSGDENYSPMFMEIQTGSVVSRAYAWTDMANTIEEYLARPSSANLTTRYGSPLIIATNLEEFAFGISYYIRSLIEDGTLNMITGAYVTESEDGAYKAVAPANLHDVKSDCFAIGNIVDWQEGTYTIAQLADMDVVVIVDAQGYSYTGSSGGGSTNDVTSKAAFLAALDNLGSIYSDVPLVLETSKLLTFGNNGFNYTPATPILVPHIVAYLYMEQLSRVAPAINPTALYRYAMQEFFHVKYLDAANVALYYIGNLWDSVDPELDRVPKTSGYIYNTTTIESAIKTGIRYALANTTNEDAFLIPAFRTNDPLYLVATGTPWASSGLSETYLTTHSQAYLDEALANYERRMVAHAWLPDTTVPGTYGYGLEPLPPTQPAQAGPTTVPQGTVGEMKNFTNSRTYTASLFTDIDENKWYGVSQQGAIAKAYALGIVDGMGENLFAPADSITLAQALKMAAVVHNTYFGSLITFDQTEGEKWYDTYVNYAIDNAIILSSDFADYNVPATRGQMAYIYANTLPEAELAAINTVTFSNIPDVSSSMQYGQDVLLLYNAGVLTGDAGTYAYRPADNITRAEAAAIITRIALPADRLTISF